MKTPLLEIKNITKIYRTKHAVVTALDGVCVSLYEGEILGLLGVNGAGKTTLSSIIATLHPPTHGTILFKGVSIYDDLLRFRKSLGFCPQTQNLDQFLTVEENLRFAGRYFLMSEKDITERINQLLEQLALVRYATYPISALSGGTKQRVLIARALMHKPALILLDEPTVGLDPDIRRKLWDQIKQLKQAGISIILTTHYLDEAEELSDRICILSKGKVLMVEELQKLKQQHGQARLEDIFLQLTQERPTTTTISQE